MALTPRIEGTVPLPDGRRLGFAEFGVPDGKPVFWFHGTPGARRQVPPAARQAALERGIRLIGIDRPGVGDSTAHLYPSMRAAARDIEIAADRLGVRRFALIGLSGGGPYVLACAQALPERAVSGAVLGGVAPTHGPDAPPGGLVRLAVPFAPIIRALREPLGAALTMLVWGLRPAAVPLIELYARVCPPGDRAVFERPEMKMILVDDLLNGSRWGLRAPVYDVVLFSQPWGFRLGDIRVPIHFWHGDHDHLVPLAHAEHMAEIVPGAELRIRHGESHLGGLAAAEEIIDTLLSDWPHDEASARRHPRSRPRRRASGRSNE